MKREWQVLLFMACAVLTSSAFCGPYNEPGIPGYVGPDGLEASPLHANAVSNPVFRAWAVEVVSYEPAPDVGYDWSDPQMALGTATGDVMDIVSLGDLSASQITAGTPAGRITLAFAEPFADGPGFEFAVFENACEFEQMFAELAYVEVSSDGVHFARFDSVSLTPSQVGPYGMIRPDDVFNLAGKHPNAYDVCTGTGFDLDDLRGDPEVVAGRVDMNNINHVRIVDIPGSGHFLDRASRNTDPCSWPPWEPFDSDHPIFDAWVTWDSGGFDLEAIGLLHPQLCRGDTNLDGKVDSADLFALADSWLTRFGQVGFNARCDIVTPHNNIIDLADFAALAAHWQCAEAWRLSQDP